MVGSASIWFQEYVARRRMLGQRLAHLEPLRARMLSRILILSAAALALQVFFFAGAGMPASKFYPGGTTIFPGICLLLSACFLRWGSPRWRTQHAVSILFVGLAFAATWSQAALLKTPANGYPQYGGVLVLTILLSGLLIGEFYVGIWTFICCVSLQFAVMESSGWKVNAGWSAVYAAAGFLVIQFSRHLERLFEANRVAEEQQRNAIVAERTRFARDIHDTLAQGFTGIMMQLNAAEQRLQTDTDARAHIQKARQLATASLEEARRSVSALRVGALAEGGLLEAMEQIGRKLTADSQVHLDAALEGQPYALPEQCEANLLRIAQEAMTNAVRHSGAERIQVRLAYRTGSVELEVGDSGRGMTGVEPAGFGVDGMRERARQMGGEIRILSDPGRGTRIVVTVPNA